MGLPEVARTLVCWSLAGFKERVEATYDYYCLNRSISEISDRLGRDKFEVRSWLQRIKESASRDSIARSHHARVARLLTGTYTDLAALEPIILHHHRYFYCLLCGKVVAVTHSTALRHVTGKHSDLIAQHVAKLVARLAHNLN